jgi:hypothetical protein
VEKAAEIQRFPEPGQNSENTLAYQPSQPIKTATNIHIYRGSKLQFME